MSQITLTFLTDDDREQFILDNQRAFKYGAMVEFGERDNHFEEDGEIISRRTPGSGRPVLRISKRGTFIFTSTNAGFTSWNSLTATIRIRMTLRPAQRTAMREKSSTECSASKSR